MKRIILCLTFASMALYSFCVNQDYNETMFSAIDDLMKSSTTEEYLQCANRFERIAAAEKEMWLPCYYAAFAYIQLSFMEEDLSKKELILDKAQQLLDKAFAIDPDESELHVLQAFLYPSRIMVDPVGRGMEYMNKIDESLRHAIELNPDNPRIYFLQAMNTLNLPPSMGGGAENARPLFELAAEKFDAFQPEINISPDWGKETNFDELRKLK
ncbi:MAG: hypothetical protein JSV24_00835, partial [Bacteroidales bacterium]